MFGQLTSGTTRYKQKDIVESLEYYGASYGSHVTHEYSLFEVNGLVKDYIPTMKMICHVFANATFPKKELTKVKSRMINGIQSIVTNHGALASHVFRIESLHDTGYEFPVSGKMKTIKKIKSRHLTERLNEYNNKIFKRVYIKGPKKVLGLKNILINDCGWKNAKRSNPSPKVEQIVKNKKIIFVPVPKANQAQVRIGRVITSNEVDAKKHELSDFAAKFMGGGFTSELVQALRVEKGLTYSVGSYNSAQLNYGRAGINTFTKNETIIELLNTTKDVIEISSKKISDKRLEMAKRNIKGNYLLGLESTSEFLKTLIIYDHTYLPYENIYKFSDRIDDISSNDLKSRINKLFGWDKQTIVIVGDKEVSRTLKKQGFDIKVVNYKNYL